MSTVRVLLVSEIAHRDRLAREHSDARMAEVWRTHDRAVRDLLPRFHGVEADRTDGFLLLFEAVDHAVAFADQLHAAMADLAQRFHLPFAARVGVHQGPVVLIETSPQDRARGAKPLEVEGLVKPTAARIMSVARPGQTLLSADARHALTGPWRAVSHGFWTLKGVAEPVELFQAGPPDGVFLPPPDGHKVRRVVPRDGGFVPLAEVPHHLPAERDPFVGRRQALQALADALQGHSLVTVTGPAGTGKTRLVTHFAWTFRGTWPGGVWFCDLAEARDLPGVVAAVAGALDVPLGATEPVEHLGRVLAHRGELLLLLDNFEQVVHLAEDTVARWRQMAPEARLLVTSRARLGLPDEHPLPLSPLDPDEAVALFTQRAQAALPDFRLTEDNRPHVEALARLLDGLPLAIELAAARVRLLSPRAILDRMDQRFRLLARPGAPRSRQDTLRGALDWSWDLLGPDEQAALAQLSVFEGGFTLPAAEAVLALTDLEPAQAVKALVGRSLVRALGGDRYGLLVSIQAYAAEKLAQSDRPGVEHRHGVFFARYGTPDALRALDLRGGAVRRRELLLELDNLLAASRRAVERGDGEVAGRTAQTIATILGARGPLRTVLQVLESALQTLHPDHSLAHALRCSLGSYHNGLGERAIGRAHLEEALERAQAGGHRETETNARLHLATLCCQMGENELAEAHFQAGLALCARTGDRVQEGSLLQYLGQLHRRQGRLEEARTTLDASLAIHREVGNHSGEGATLSQLATVYQVTGRIQEAQEAYEAALQAQLDFGDVRFVGATLHNLALLHIERGEPRVALPLLERALVIHREVGSRPLEAFALAFIASAHRLLEDLPTAREHYAAALAIHRDVASPVGILSTSLNLAHVLIQEGRLDLARQHLEEALPLSQTMDNLAIQGMTYACWAELHIADGEPEEAGRAFDLAEAALHQAGRPMALGQLLAERAAFNALRDPAAAQADLQEAESILAQTGATLESELGRQIARARAALAASTPPEVP